MKALDRRLRRPCHELPSGVRPVLPTIKGPTEGKSDLRTDSSGSGESYVKCLCSTWPSREPLEVSSTTAPLAINHWTSALASNWVTGSCRAEEHASVT